MAEDGALGLDTGQHREVEQSLSEENHYRGHAYTERGEGSERCASIRVTQM